MSHSTKWVSAGIVVLISGCGTANDSTATFDTIDSNDIGIELVTDAPVLAPTSREVEIHSDFFVTGYQIPEDYGLSDWHPIIPRGGSQSWFFGQGFSYEFIHAAERSLELVRSQVSWPVTHAESEQTTDVLFSYDASDPSPACDGSAHGQCWYASTECINKLPELVDVDQHRPCAQWVITITVANIQAWSDVNGSRMNGQVEAVIMHEFGHTLGFSHLPKNGYTQGIMKPFVKESYISIGYTACELAQLDAYHQIDDAGIHMVLPKECSQ